MFLLKLIFLFVVIAHFSCLILYLFSLPCECFYNHGFLIEHMHFLELQRVNGRKVCDLRALTLDMLDVSVFCLKYVWVKKLFFLSEMQIVIEDALKMDQIQPT